MSCWALIPIKMPALGKGRLAGVLAPAERQRLVRVMLDRVLDALEDSQLIEHVAIVTPATDLTRRAVALMPDTGLGLNGSVHQTATMLARRGASELLVMHGDLPLAHADDIDELVRQGRHAGLALAPDRDRAGTNAIYLPTGTSFRFQFGTNSFARHVAESLRCGRVPAVVERSGLAFDVDLPADLARFAGTFTACGNRASPFPSLYRNPLPWPTAHSESSPIYARD